MLEWGEEMEDSMLAKLYSLWQILSHYYEGSSIFILYEFETWGGYFLCLPTLLPSIRWYLNIYLSTAPHELQDYFITQIYLHLIITVL